MKHNVEQRSPEWHQLRKGKVTGTSLKAIMGTPKARQDTIYELVAERLTIGVEGDDYESPMDRGTRLEPDALSAFGLATGKSVDKIGLIQDDKNPLMANSPDGLIEETEAIEVKCMGGKNHVKMWLTNEIPDEYFWQSIQYFVVNEKLERLYFVGYNPEIPTHPLHVIELTRDNAKEDIEKAREAQENFLEDVEAILKTIIKI